MKKCVSIIMAIIILFSVSANTELLTASAKTPATITASVKAKARKKKKHKHNVPKGNMGKWFKSRKALKKYVAKEMKYWADL